MIEHQGHVSYPVDERVRELLVDALRACCCCSDVDVLTAVAAARMVGGLVRATGDLPP